MKVIVGISGASGANLGIKTLKALPDTIQKHLILSEHAQIVLEKEENLTIHQNHEIWASVASGSYGADAMIVTPCSMNTLAKIACGIADNLITRAAAVMIKERRTLVLAPREIPYSPIALENMHKLSMMGVVIAPPVLAYYGEQNTLEAMENFMIGKWFDLLGIDNDLYKRWDDK
ncbi:UbiX family flavin prenyltransferase [Sulfuricurvum sp.]|uniref:UbiX family flavin prenyltransferase n=1 Tax=Sulfuricurvum sp. TaxID=2025608 RepID=UPI0026271CAF|nr:UbiX family flavin prenyltransferase [Sulfuricurvum sp.]MDD3594830.1 UbiX family flavin prenyltransferase [Sulfuricurvum sp.]MDD4883549.1 UbiX family flavin prenyltransferase [Sulfuricurvum sp.]